MLFLSLLLALDWVIIYTLCYCMFFVPQNVFDDGDDEVAAVG